jgi:hypothetical protein
LILPAVSFIENRTTSDDGVMMRAQSPLAWCVMFFIASTMLGTAWFFRYSITADGPNSFTKLDRWTGKVQSCYVTVCSDWR